MYNELPNLLAGITYYIIYIINIIFFVISISETVLLAYIFHSSSQMTTMLVVGQVWLSDCCWTSDILQCCDCLSLLCGLHTCAAGCAQMSPGLSFWTSLVDHCLCEQSSMSRFSSYSHLWSSFVCKTYTLHSIVEVVLESHSKFGMHILFCCAQGNWGYLFWFWNLFSCSSSFLLESRICTLLHHTSV